MNTPSHDHYLAPSRFAEFELKERGSRFIARVHPVSNEQEIETVLSELRKREHTASHHCYAWIIRTRPVPPSESDFRYSDDGEPNGSAGRPIYDQVLGSGLTNVLCVVTRYFGGTKLGVGGLVRAYGSAAKQSLELAGAESHYDEESFRLEVDFSLYTPLTKLLSEFSARTVSSVFGERPSLIIAMRQTNVESFLKRFADFTHGKGVVERINSSENQQ